MGFLRFQSIQHVYLSSSSLKSFLQLLNSGSGQPSITVSTAREKASYEGQALVPFSLIAHRYAIFLCSWDVDDSLVGQLTSPLGTISISVGGRGGGAG